MQHKIEKSNFLTRINSSLNMKKIDKQAFTLIELIIVVMIVGILTGIAAPSFMRSRERAMDRQAQVILKTIRVAEKSYKLDYTTHAVPLSTVPSINNVLELDLADNGEWTYSVTGGASSFTATMTRNRGGYSRTWTITQSDTNPTCSGNCP